MGPSARLRNEAEHPSVNARLAPEVVPRDGRHDQRKQESRVAHNLIGEFGQERAHAPREIDGRLRSSGAEEPDRIGRIIGGEGHQPEQRRGEERHAEKLAHAS